MPVAGKRTPGVPEGTRIATAKVDMPSDAAKSVRGKTRAISYAANAIDRAVQEWFKEHQDIPNWEDMIVTVWFTTFSAHAQVDDRLAHERTSMG